MKYRKHIVAGTMLALMLASSASAETLTVDAGGTVAPGDTGVSVGIVIDEGSNTAGASFTVNYDAAKLDYVGVTSSFFGTFAAQGITPTSVDVDGVTYTQGLVDNSTSGAVLLAAAQATNGAAGQQTLFTLTFNVKNDAASGDTQISISQTTITNADAGYSTATAIPYLVGVEGNATDGYTYPEVPVTSTTPGTLAIGNDSDGDGIDDDWETVNFGNLTTANATSDTDKDGYSDLQEYTNQKNSVNDPNDNAFNPNVLNAPGGVGYDISTDAFVKNDFNRDGTADITFRRSTDNLVSTWLIENGTVAGGGSAGTLGDVWTIRGIGDYDGDNNADYLLQHDDGTIYVWLMTGPYIRDGWRVGKLGSEWSVQNAGDFNGDGMADITFRRSTDNLISTWLCDGANKTIIGGGSAGGLGAVWTIIDIGDYDGDKKADMLLQHDDGTIYIWFMTGPYVKGGWRVGKLGSEWTVQNAGDFNGDGMADIIFRRSTDNLISTWLIDGQAQEIIGGGSPGSLGSVWTIKSVGDYDCDRKSDLLLQHDDGTVYIWFMEGAYLKGGARVGALGSDWSIQQ